MAKLFRVLSALALIAFVLLLPAAQMAGAEKALDPCALLTQAEIQEAIGSPVKANKPKANPGSVADCSYTVGDYGTFNLLLKPLNASETPDRIYAEFKKRKLTGAELPGVGDRSFYINPGYGMTQLFTFKGGRYILITMLVPGATEKVQNAAAEKLMRKLLPRL